MNPVQVAGAVGGEDDDGFGYGFDGAVFGDGDLEIGQEFQEVGFKRFVGAV